VVVIVVEVVTIHHFSRFCDKNGQFSIKNEANFLIRLNRFAANHSHFLCSDDSRKSFRRPWNGVPAALERRSDGLGTVFRRLWNGVPTALEWRSDGLGTVVECIPEEQGTALFRPLSLAETIEIVVEVVI